MSQSAEPLDNTSSAKENELFGHPKGLFYLFFAELWERFSFYGMRALLTLYMVEKVFDAIQAKDAVAAIVYSSYGSLVYATPVIGGRLADKIMGYRNSIMLGGVLMAIGHFVLAFEDNILFYLALSFIIVGNGFFKPNISTFVGTLYETGDVRKDKGFTIFYMGINIGALASPLLCGYLAAEFGYHYGFGLAGFGMLTGLLFFYAGMKKGVFGDKGMPPEDRLIDKKTFGIKAGHWVVILSFLAVPLIAYLLSSFNYLGFLEPFFGEVTIVNVLFRLLGIIVLAYIIWIIYQVDLAAKLKLISAVLLTIFMTVFWGFHELSGSVLTLFADRNVDLVWLNAAQTNFINPAFIILLSIPMSALWGILSKRNANPRTPFKFAMGLALLGVGFYILSLARGSASAGMVPMIYLLIMYFLISAGELFMSPVGLSKITDLSPAKFVAFMMGVWFLSSAFAFQVVGFVAKQLAIEENPGKEIDPVVSLPIYSDGFELIAYYSFGAAVIALIIAPLMKRWMANVH
ncbi:oligopeptide:H+ symporter [Mangrovivirga sp. M17]|uniref:Oligopeptide:H+ symporter n=1 Tax=Mangrovivirga halotolerans TaxID=2993936 RepID=A0ABT3RWF3_9BACT|nr:oligopeptide:H+ symporter [Mangrovivirga halotolerans]MCX2745659.1 oligopeptide:H+ symporter [Mangrovivirga halotolerans]